MLWAFLFLGTEKSTSPITLYIFFSFLLGYKLSFLLVKTGAGLGGGLVIPPTPYSLIFFYSLVSELLEKSYTLKHPTEI